MWWISIFEHLGRAYAGYVIVRDSGMPYFDATAAAEYLSDLAIVKAASR